MTALHTPPATSAPAPVPHEPVSPKRHWRGGVRRSGPPDQGNGQDGDHGDHTRRQAARRMLRLAPLVLVGLMVVYQFWVTSVEADRHQTSLLRDLQRELAAPPAGDAAAVPDAGRPVALVEIPKLGIEQVAVEGTSSRNLAMGPARLTGSALPGENGMVVLLGRRDTGSAPFSGLERLMPGDRIVVIGATGRYTYAIAAAPPKQGSASLALITSAPGWFSSGSTVVYAQLEGPALAPPADSDARPVLSDADALARARAEIGWFRDSGALLAIGAWLSVLTLVLGATWLAYRLWPSRVVYLLSTPVVVAVLFGALGSLSRVFPPTR